MFVINVNRRYPTKANIELHKAEELEKSERGEIIKQYSSTQTKTKRSTKICEKKRVSRKRHRREINSNSLRTDTIYRGLHPFPGTGKRYIVELIYANYLFMLYYL